MGGVPIVFGIFGGLIFLVAGGIIVLAFVLVIRAIIMGPKWRAERVARIKALAAEIGLEVHEQDPWRLHERYGQAFDLFRRGSDRQASDLLSGRIDGRRVLLFEYEYETESGTGKDKRTTTWHHRVALLELPIGAPHLAMRTEGPFDRLASWVGYDDIDFESDEFSRRYHVRSDDRRFAYDIFHVRLIDYLLRLGDAPDLEMSGPLLLVTESGTWEADRMRRLLDVGRRVIASIPDYVVNARPASQRLPHA